nr:AAA family ATPase [Pedobacter panaciterrae]
MKYKEFKIRNFKGIDDISIDLDSSPDANIYTLVGLNESGKTTILEAINLFNRDDKGLGMLDFAGGRIKDYNELIPISKRDNFNGRITLIVTISLDDDDILKINQFAKKKTKFSQVRTIKTLTYTRHYIFKDSKFVDVDSRWSGFDGILKTSTTRTFINIGGTSYAKDNTALAKYCRELIPSILYFPNFLFDFPSKISLKTDGEISEKEKFYSELVQDILFSLENELNIQTHLIDRVRSEDPNDKRNLNSLSKKMGKKVTDVVFKAWNSIFKRELRDTRINISIGLDADDCPFLEFEIETHDGIYQINERSLGFRWFFVFLLFTQFRPFRENAPKNVIYLFDEPASNLHSYAQSQLLKSFENLTKNSKIIYTTHSHHLINPKWLESTFVVKNEGVKLEKPEFYTIDKTNISIEAYRSFVTNHPHNTAYFQPILDVLDYAPSNLENVPNCIFLEGKNDYYTLMYFKDIVLELDFTLNLSPSSSSGNMDTLISLYLGWGKEFLVLLDSDKEGRKQHTRYEEAFGISVEGRIFTLESIDSEWKSIAMEKLFQVEELLAFQKTTYPDSEVFNKTHFNRSIQENLIKKQKFEFSEETQEHFKAILLFLDSKINKL